MGSFFVESWIDVSSLISEIGTVLWPLNAFMFLWASVQLAQMNMQQVWQKEVTFTAPEQLWQVISLLSGFCKIAHSSVDKEHSGEGAGVIAHHSNNS